MRYKWSAKLFMLVLLAYFAAQINSAIAYSYSGIHWHSEMATLKYDVSLPTSMQAGTYRGQEITWDQGTNSDFHFDYSSSSGNLVKYGYIKDMSVLAQTVTSYNGTTKHITKNTLTYNDRINWHTDVTKTPPSNKYDAWSVAAHEFGHWLQLNHSSKIISGYKPTMYAYINAGEYFPRNLSQDDKDGIAKIYDSGSH